MFSPSKPFKPSHMFVSKTRVYLSVAPLQSRLLVWLARVKHSSLFGTFINHCSQGGSICKQASLLQMKAEKVLQNRLRLQKKFYMHFIKYLRIAFLLLDWTVQFPGNGKINFGIST